VPPLVSVLLFAGAALAFVGYWLVWSPQPTVSLTGALVKTASTGLLAAVGALFSGPLPWAIVLGLTLGALGDFFLARRHPSAFLTGMAAFALGHLAYAWAFLSRAAEIAPFQLAPAQGLAGLALLVLLLSTEVWLAPRTAALRWPVRGYVVVIGLMGLAAIALPPHPENLSAALIRLGAALFVLSDLLLAIRLFVARTGPATRGLSLALWPAYWGGQLLILVGAGLYALPFGG
jgi:uncharacterized membrane protein YhhN